MPIAKAMVLEEVSGERFNSRSFPLPEPELDAVVAEVMPCTDPHILSEALTVIYFRS